MKEETKEVEGWTCPGGGFGLPASTEAGMSWEEPLAWEEGGGAAWSPPR